MVRVFTILIPTHVSEAYKIGRSSGNCWSPLCSCCRCCCYRSLVVVVIVSSKLLLLSLSLSLLVLSLLLFIVIVVVVVVIIVFVVTIVAVVVVAALSLSVRCCYRYCRYLFHRQHYYCHNFFLSLSYRSRIKVYEKHI